MELKKALHIAGVDEVGRGCLAGPVVAAAVILPDNFYIPFLTDSKKLSPLKRQEIAIQIKAQATAWAFGFSWPKEIDRINILQASLKAMQRAVLNLKQCPDLIFVDGKHKIPLELPQKAVIKGDLLIPQISAASILAKVIRDKVMFSLDKKYPGYGFKQHKGYGTKLHLQKIKLFGPSPMHRLSFKGVKEFRSKWLPGISLLDEKGKF
ncbi:MAG: ribonuclease HII [Desulfonauticus sp.]|nr:ribonuclease HII [Desulfonauticus sp.]